MAEVPLSDDARLSWRRFLRLWGAEMLSITGTGLTAFALGAWVYAQTHRTTDYALLSAAAVLPGVLLLPFGGVLADALPRRAVMWWCNLIAGLCTMALIALVWQERLWLGAIYACLAISALCRALQWVTFTATMTQLVPDRHLGRMSALIYVGEAGQQTLAPGVAALCLPWLRHEGVMALDLSTFVLALLVITLTPIPRAEAHATLATARQAILSGWRFITARRGLLWLQVFFALSQFLGGFLPLLVLPLLMELSGSERVTGVAMGAAGAGMIVGTALLAWRPVRRLRARWTLVMDACASAMMLLLALVSWRAGAWGVGVFGFLFLVFHAIESGISQDLWQRAVPARLQGRVFAIRRALSWSLVPVCYLLAGPLTEAITPHTTPDHAAAALLGTGATGAMLTLLAIAAALRLLVLVPAFAAIPSLRALDDPALSARDGQGG